MIDIQATLALMAGPPRWTAAQTARLCQMWWDGVSREELLQTFPGRTWGALKARAGRYGAIRPAWFRSIAARRGA